MGFSTKQISPKTVQCLGSGNIDYDAFIELFEELARTVGTLDEIGLRCDLRGCPSTLDFGEELRIVDYLKKHERLFIGSNWAFIVDSPQLAELAKLGGVLVSVTSLRFGFNVFHSPEAADEWLSGHTPNQQCDLMETLA